MASRLDTYSRWMASWCGNEGTIFPGRIRPGYVRYYISHSVQVKGKQRMHVFAVTDWLKLQKMTVDIRTL